MEEGLRNLPQFGQVNGQVEMRGGEAGIDPDRFKIMRHRFQRFALIFQGHSKIMFGHKIVPRDLESMFEKRAAVLPASQIEAGGPPQC